MFLIFFNKEWITLVLSLLNLFTESVSGISADVFISWPTVLFKRKTVPCFVCIDCNSMWKRLGEWVRNHKTVIFYVTTVCLLSSPDGCLRCGRVPNAVVLRRRLLAEHKLCEKNPIHYATWFSQMFFRKVETVLSFCQAALIKRIEHYIETNYFKRRSFDTSPRSLLFFHRLSCSCGRWKISQWLCS